MKTFYVICCMISIGSPGWQGSALTEFEIERYIDDKLGIDKNIPEFSTEDEAISWFEELRVKVQLELDKYNNSKHGFFSYPILTDLSEGEIYIVKKVKF